MDSPRTWTEQREQVSGKRKRERRRRREDAKLCVQRVFDHYGLCDLQAYLGVLHHALDAVEVGEVADRLVGIVQHSPDSLGDNE